MKQFRGRDASLWQSAVDQVVAKRNAAASPAAGFGPGPGVAHLKRPDQDDSAIQFGNDIAEAIDIGAVVPMIPAPATQAAGLVDTAKFCATAAYKLAEAEVHAAITGDHSKLAALHAQLDTPFGACDPKWGEVLAIYVANRIASLNIPYRRYKNLSDFVIKDRLPPQATVALLADWGTGQDSAKKMLVSIARYKPDVVIHLGDVYYSGTQSEVQNYFYSIWQPVLGIPRVPWGTVLTDLKTGPATFHLPGNHDMYAGGQPYYSVIDMLGQPASYFCLQNDDWQFLAMDTSLHDSNPVTVADATSVDPDEVIWMKDKVNNAGGRKTILLSHHQLFTAFEKIGGAPVNNKLLPQVQDILPKLTAWLWGHEHNLVIYEKYLNVLGRCIGHGAFPVSAKQLQNPPNAGIPLADVTLAPDGNGFYRHGYVIMKLDGPKANLTYYQYNADTDSESVLFTESL
ncbi:MAG: metallophosphoesterase [Edaphobacter sp.]